MKLDYKYSHPGLEGLTLERLRSMPNTAETHWLIAAELQNRYQRYWVNFQRYHRRYKRIAERRERAVSAESGRSK